MQVADALSLEEKRLGEKRDFDNYFIIFLICVLLGAIVVRLRSRMMTLVAHRIFSYEIRAMETKLRVQNQIFSPVRRELYHTAVCEWHNHLSAAGALCLFSYVFVARRMRQRIQSPFFAGTRKCATKNAAYERCAPRQVRTHTMRESHLSKHRSRRDFTFFCGTLHRTNCVCVCASVSNCVYIYMHVCGIFGRIVCASLSFPACQLHSERNGRRSLSLSLSLGLTAAPRASAPPPWHGYSTSSAPPSHSNTRRRTPGDTYT